MRDHQSPKLLQPPIFQGSRSLLPVVWFTTLLSQTPFTSKLKKIKIKYNDNDNNNNNNNNSNSNNNNNNNNNNNKNNNDDNNNNNNDNNNNNKNNNWETSGFLRTGYSLELEVKKSHKVQENTSNLEIKKQKIKNKNKKKNL